MKNMSVSVNMQCYIAYVLPVLMLASETWALTKQQTQSLECVHARCEQLAAAVTCATL